MSFLILSNINKYICIHDRAAKPAKYAILINDYETQIREGGALGARDPP